MPGDLKAHKNQLRAKARRAHALARCEFAYPSVPRVAASGVTSFPVKKIDTETAAAIAEFLARRGGQNGGQT